MSQNIDYQRLVAVSEATNFQRNFGPVISQIFNTAPTEVISGVKHCCTRKRNKTNYLLSPSELNVIQTDYEEQLNVAKLYNENETSMLKVAAISTLTKEQDNLIVSNPSAVFNMVQHILEAETTQEVKQETRKTFQEIKKQHTGAFVSNVTAAVKESAIAIGFKEISLQEPKAGMIRIVASNGTGQDLLAEIKADKQVDIHTELVGYTDGSCAKVIRSFDAEMVKRGIITEQKEIQPTLGIPILPYAKKLLKQRTFKSREFADVTLSPQEVTTNQTTIKR